jgi:hypothetical protein
VACQRWPDKFAKRNAARGSHAAKLTLYVIFPRKTKAAEGLETNVDDLGGRARPLSRMAAQGNRAGEAIIAPI